MSELEGTMKGRSTRGVVTKAMCLACLLVPTLPFAVRAEYTERTVVNGGTISGKIVYNGRPPHLRQVSNLKDPRVCGATRFEDAWSVAADGAVESVVVFLADVKSGKKMEAPTKPVLDQRGCHYVPHVQVVPLHAHLQVKSSDPIAHNVHSFFNGATVINFAMPPGTRVLVKTLDKSGGQQLKCDVHSFMRGGIFVAETPYYALTGPDGSYTIKDVPPGTYTIATWHEQAGELFDSVTVAPGLSVVWNGKIR